MPSISRVPRYFSAPTAQPSTRIGDDQTDLGWIPGRLLTDPLVPSSAKLVYAVTEGGRLQLSYAEIGRRCGVTPQTARLSILALIAGGWVEAQEPVRYRPVAAAAEGVAR